MPSLKMSLKRRLALERELDRRAIEAGLALPTPPPPPPKLTAIQASIAARKERTLASLGPKAGKAARQHMLDVEMEKERLAFQLKREQLERQVSSVSTQGAARKRVAWADSEKRVHMVESYKKLNRKINKRYEVDDEFIDLRSQVDAAGGWTSSSTLRGVNRIRAPGWMSVNGYQSMPDDWKDIEDNMEEDNDETF